MKKLLRRSVMVLAVTALSALGTAGPCTTQTANNIAADDGCTVTVGLGFVVTFTFSNFTFALGTVTAPGGFTAIDNTISFSGGYGPGGYPEAILTDTGDGLWNISSGQWGFTLAYDVASTGWPITDFKASEGGASATGTGGSSITETSGGLISTATTSNPNPPFTHGFNGVVMDVVVNNAGTGTSNLTSVSNTFETPEPMTPILLGSGLLALGLLARWRPSR
jgi:hypothetical protein